MKIIDQTVLAFSKENAPVCHADPGDLLLFKTQDCFGRQFTSEAQLVHDLDMSKANPATGPVLINGADVGDVLVVDILDVQVAQAGFACSIPDMGPLSHLSETRTRMIPVIDGVASYHGLKWHVDPMIGVIGTAPSGDPVACGFAGDHGGNMDSRVIKKGARVYLPVRVKGALLQLGDLHASMGDGELCGTGIEIAGEVIVRVSLIKDFLLHWPVTETPDMWYVNATNEHYGESLRLASVELARLACPVYGWDVTDFFIYLSIQGEVALNQGLLPVMTGINPFINLRVGIPKLVDKALIS